MEHRCANRYASDLNIQIYQHKLPVALGRIKNASLSGVFVETEFADIDCEHQISLEILSNRKTMPSSKRIKIQALITHKRNNGFGAELDLSAAEHADFFSNLLLGQQVNIDASATQKMNKSANG